jgi:AraC-like DNA-binding protein
LADPANDLPLADLARASGASLRTLQRRFLEETGMPLAEWRQSARLMQAAAHLLDGDSITSAALQAGYAGTSAFIHAFKKKLGETPTSFRTTGRGQD